MEDRFIWALDLSLTNSGITIFQNDASKPIFISSIYTGKNTTHPEKLKIFGTEILKIREKYKCDEAAIERGFYRFAKSTESSYKVLGVLQYLLYDVPQYFYSPLSVKKFITGRGNAQKEELRDCILQSYNVEFENLDQSDSFAIGLFHFSKIINGKEQS